LLFQTYLYFSNEKTLFVMPNRVIFFCWKDFIDRWTHKLPNYCILATFSWVHLTLHQTNEKDPSEKLIIFLIFFHHISCWHMQSKHGCSVDLVSWKPQKQTIPYGKSCITLGISFLPIFPENFWILFEIFTVVQYWFTILEITSYFCCDFT
jgi:hypothetical protein